MTRYEFVERLTEEFSVFGDFHNGDLILEIDYPFKCTMLIRDTVSLSILNGKTGGNFRAENNKTYEETLEILKNEFAFWVG